MRNCVFCGADIYRPRGFWSLWTARGTALAIHDAEYCPSSKNHSHQPEEV